MAVNKYKKHLLILSEDDAYRDIVLGFLRHDAVFRKKIQLDAPAGGWAKLVDIFSKEYVPTLRNYTDCHVLLLLDLDGDRTRREDISRQIPPDIQNRVFILCCRGEAEDVKKDLKCTKFEIIGEKLAESCYDDSYGASDAPWLCDQLQHNKAELIRLAEAVRPFLF